MWSEICDIYSPEAEERNRLKNIHLETLEIIYDRFKDYEKYLKENKPKNKCIPGLELAAQIIFNIIQDKKKVDE